MRGAGGTEGGVGLFLLGLAMFTTGGYLFLDAVQVHTSLGWGHGLYQMGGIGISGGMILVPFAVGVGLVFYNAHNIAGWLLAGLSLLALGFGVLRSLRFQMMPMSTFDLIVILVLIFGGLGLLAGSLRARPG